MPDRVLKAVYKAPYRGQTIIRLYQKRRLITVKNVCANDHAPNSQSMKMILSSSEVKLRPYPDDLPKTQILNTRINQQVVAGDYYYAVYYCSMHRIHRSSSSPAGRRLRAVVTFAVTTQYSFAFASCSVHCFV